MLGLASVTRPPSLIPILKPASVISSRARLSSLSFFSGSEWEVLSKVTITSTLCTDGALLLPCLVVQRQHDALVLHPGPRLAALGLQSLQQPAGLLLNLLLFVLVNIY